jgi:hypothetical protein
MLGLTGCVERTLNVQSNPPGAVVYLNDQEVGRTPLSKRFVWYGTYDVQVRKEGYETLKTESPIIAPWWQWVPFDFFAEIAPLKLEDVQSVSYSLIKPLVAQNVDPTAIVQRGEQLRARLESSQVADPKAHSTTRP